MATYIPNVTDYVPQVQPFRPDFNFYAGALQMKQTQYDNAHSQLSSLYGSLLNAPMLRGQNIKARDDYFNAINGEIRKIANLDLSKRENVTAASNLFRGLYDNKNIIKDMAWTRNYQKELSRAEGFKNCTDPEECGGEYWQDGVKALNYRADEFMKATDDQALGFANAEYVPYQNVMEKAIKIAKDAGLNITVDQLQGRYITTTKNGPMLIDPLNSLFTGVFGNDPQIMSYYQTKAYVDRKDWIFANAGMLGSEAAAESAYVDMATQGLTRLMGVAKQDIDARVENFTGQKRQLEDKIRRDGTTPNSSLAEQYRQLNDYESNAVEGQRVIDNNNGTLKNLMNPETRSAVVGNIDALMANMYMANDINAAANTLAYKDYQFKMKADPYALENVRQANRLALEDVKFENRKLLERFKYDLKNWEEKKLSMGGEGDNIPVLTPIVGGGADVNLEEGGAYKMFKKKEEGFIKDVSGAERGILVDMLKITQMKSKSERGAGMATDDLVKFGDIIFNELTNVDTRYYVEGEGDYGEFVGNSQRIHDNRILKDKWDKMSYSQKVKYAQSQDFDKLINQSGISGTVLDNVYNDFALPLMDQTNEANRVNRDYLGTLWANSAGARNDIVLKNQLLEGMGEWQAGQTERVIQNMKTSDTYKDWAPMMQLYIDPETGAPRGKEEFATAFAQAYDGREGYGNYDENYAYGLALYEGEGANVPLTRAMREGGVTNPMALYETYSAMTLDRGLPEVWREAFSQYMDPEGGAMALGLIGSDSQAAMGLMFPNVDPSKYASAATMNTMTFMRDVVVAGAESTRFAIGIPGAELPESSSGSMQAFANQLSTDMSIRNSAKDKNRPILNVTYQDIAGGDSEWTALNIKVNQPYLKQFVGTEKKPGLLTPDESNALTQNGFTVYLKKDAANNGFRQGVDKSPVEQTMFYTGEYKFDAYPGVTRDLKLTQNPSGGYTLSGDVMAGVDENGNPNWELLYVPYNSLGTDPTYVVSDINTWLEEVNRGNQSMIANYNATNGTKDPQALLNQ